MKKPWIVIACAAFIVTLAMGVRQSFGLFAGLVHLPIADAPVKRPQPA